MWNCWRSSIDSHASATAQRNARRHSSAPAAACSSSAGGNWTAWVTVEIAGSEISSSTSFFVFRLRREGKTGRQPSMQDGRCCGRCYTQMSLAARVPRMHHGGR